MHVNRNRLCGRGLCLGVFGRVIPAGTTEYMDGSVVK